MQIHSKAINNLRLLKGRACVDCEYDSIVRNIEQNQPSLVGQVGYMCEYVAAYSGGADANFLKYLQTLSRIMIIVRRGIPGVLFRVLANTQFSEGPEYTTAMIKASLRAPDGMHRDNVANMLAGADTSQIVGAHKAKCIE
eukprot:6624659-Pyramimonas_sp.AAC.1